jgi:hypothetical protein
MLAVISLSSYLCACLSDRLLAEDLKRLKHHQEITSPVDQKKVLPAAYILFDAPLGRAHGETGQYIDLMVYLDTPLDVAMARPAKRRHGYG